MATLIAADITNPSDRDAHEARIIQANRKMAELQITRCDYRYLSDGMRRFLQAIARMEK